MQKEEEESDPKDKKDKGKAKAPEAKKEENQPQENEENIPPEPKFKEIPNSVLKDFEKETQEIVEFIYSCGEYNELVKAKLDIYKDILDTFKVVLDSEYPLICIKNKGKNDMYRLACYSKKSILI